MSEFIPRNLLSNNYPSKRVFMSEMVITVISGILATVGFYRRKIGVMIVHFFI